MIFFACDNASPDTAESTDSFKNFDTEENILITKDKTDLTTKWKFLLL
jgi:hypothetical protein